MPFDSHKVGRLVAEVMRVRAETGIEPVCVCNAALIERCSRLLPGLQWRCVDYIKAGDVLVVIPDGNPS